MISGIRRAGRGVLGLALGALLIASTSHYGVRPAEAAPGRTAHALLFVTDGGQPDLFRQFAREGVLPTYARLEAEGSMAAGGMVPQLPTSTRVGWQTLSTGAWAGTHGSLNNVFTRHGLGMGQSYPAGTYSPLEAETLAETAEASGLKVLLYDWNSSDQPPIAGPTIKYWRTYTRAGVAQNYADPRAAQGAAAWGLMFDHLTLAPAPGGAPALISFSPLVAGSLRLSAFDGPAYEYGVRLYDSSDDGRANYDRAALLAGEAVAADLAVGDWAEVRLKLSGGADEGRTAGFYLKLMALTPDLSRVKFFVSAVSRVNAQPAALEDYLADHFPTRAGVEGALIWDGLIDEATYAEAAALTIHFNRRVLPWLLQDYAPDTNLAMIGYLNTDIIQHAVLALVTPGTPVYDDADRDGRPDGRLEARLGYLRETYRGADQTLAAAWEAMPADTVVVAASDHGFAPTWKAVYAPHVLASAGLQPEPQTANCAASDRVLAKACWVGGAVMIYMNVMGRDPNGVVPRDEYLPVRNRIVATWQALRDSDGTPITAAVFTAEEAGALPSGWAAASLAHPDKTGDVIVFVNPPYQFDFAEGGTPVRDMTVWWAAHGHLPQSGTGRTNANLFATFYIAGPGIRHGQPARVRSIDVAPTLAYLLGLPAPAQAEGQALFQVLATRHCRLAELGVRGVGCGARRR